VLLLALLPIVNAGSTATTPVKKGVVVYGKTWLSGYETSFIADHFDYLDTDFVLANSSLQELNTKNPDLVIVGYKCVLSMAQSLDDWAEVLTHEDWFLHDASGNKIADTTTYDYTNYVMDINSSGWQQHYADYVNSKMAAKPLFNGVFMDNAADSLPAWAYASWNSTPTAETISQYHANMITCLEHITTDLTPGKILVINTWEHETQDFLDVMDSSSGKMAEWFGSLYTGAYTLEEPYTAENLDFLASDSGTGKINWWLSYTYEDNPVYPDNVQFDYCAFLLALNGSKTLFSANAWQSSDYSHGYYSIMDTDIGTSSTNYYIADSVYQRNFTKGKVLLNPDSASHFVDLGGEYSYPNGTIITNMTMQGYTGEILFDVTYTLTLNILSPAATTYTSVNVPVSLTASGNETGITYNWNVRTPNATWLYPTNKTATSTTITASFGNGTYTFACSATGTHGATDYKETSFAISLTTTTELSPGPPTTETEDESSNGIKTDYMPVLFICAMFAVLGIAFYTKMGKT